MRMEWSTKHHEGETWILDPRKLSSFRSLFPPVQFNSTRTCYEAPQTHNPQTQTEMKYLNSLKLAAAVLLLVTTVSVLAQPAPGGPGGPGGRGGGRGGFFGPPLPPEQQALVDKINTELAAENLAVAAASSNLVAASFITPKDTAKITEANNALAKAREVWATKASTLFTKIQSSDTKLSEEAIARLVATASGRGGRGGGFGGPGTRPRGGGPGGPPPP